MSLVLLLVAALAMYVSVGDATPMACHNSGCGDCGAHAPAAACPPALSASLVAAANAAAAAPGRRASRAWTRPAWRRAA